MPTIPSTLRKRPQSTGVLSDLLHALIGRMGPSRHTDASGFHHAPISIGIQGLPDGVGQLPQQVPVTLVAADKSSAALWLPGLLQDAVAQGPVALVASSAQWIDELLLYPPLHEAYRTGRLALWVRLPDLKIQMQSHGLTPLLQELEQTGLTTEHALYLCDPDLLSGLSVAQLARISRQLTALCHERLRPVVLGFFAPPESEVLLLTLRNLCQMSMHIATLRTEADRWSLNLERWNAGTGALFQTAFGLLHDAASGRLTADGTRTHGAVSKLTEAVDQLDVIATRAAVQGQRGVPSHWRLVDGVADLEAAAATSVAATVLIDAGYASEFEERARLVHHLRRSHPLTLKIVVRENLGKLRIHSEQALLQLGANAVVYKELGFSRVLQQLLDLNLQSYTHQVDPDYAQALSSFMPALDRGYQPPAQFCRLVHDMLDRTHSIGLSHSLVQLTLLAQVPHLDALRACHTARDGDVFTADHEAVYVFLFACREPDVQMALSRLFRLPLTQLFAFEATDCSDAGIRALAGNLQESLRKGLPDYTELLNAGTPSALAVTTAASGTSLIPAAAALPDLLAEPANTSVPTMPATQQTAHLPYTATAPSVQHRPIARRTARHTAARTPQGESP